MPKLVGQSAPLAYMRGVGDDNPYLLRGIERNAPRSYRSIRVIYLYTLEDVFIEP
jgi:hypothetical protein